MRAAVIHEMSRVTAASRLTVAFEVSRLFREQVDDQSQILHRPAQKLIDELQTFAIDADIADVHLRIVDRRFERERYEIRWWPTTTEVQLLGGPQDGEVLAVRDVTQPLRLATTDAAALCLDSAMSPTIVTVDYRLFGWDDVAHRWVMKAKHG